MARVPNPNVGSAARLLPRPFSKAPGGKRTGFILDDGTQANVRPIDDLQTQWLWDDGLVTDQAGNPIAGPVLNEAGEVTGYVDAAGKPVVKEAYDMLVGDSDGSGVMPDDVAASDPAGASIDPPDVTEVPELDMSAPDDPNVEASAPTVEAAPNIQSLARKVNDLGGSILNNTDEANQQFINQVADEIMRQYDASGNPLPQMQALLADPVMKERLDAVIGRADDSPGAPPSPADEGPDPYTGETPDQRATRRLNDEEQKLSRQGAYAIPGNKRRLERLKELGLTAREAPLAQKPRYERKPAIQKETGPVGPKKGDRASQADTAAQMARTAVGFSGDPRARGNVARSIEERVAAGEANLINPVTGSIATTPESAVPALEDSRSLLSQQLEAVRRKQQLIVIGNRKGTLSDADADAAMRPLMEERAAIEQELAGVNQKLRGIVPDSGISGVIPDPATVTLEGEDIENLAAGRVGSRQGLPQKIPDSRRNAALRTAAVEGRGTAMVPSKEATLINDGENPVAAMPNEPDFTWERKSFRVIKDKKTGKMRDFDPKLDKARKAESKTELRWVPSWNPRRGQPALVQRPVRYDMPIEWFVGDGPGLQSADEFVKHVSELGGYHDVLMKSPLAQDMIRQLMDRTLLPDSPIYGNRDLFRATRPAGATAGDWIPDGQTADDVYDELGRLRNPVPLLGDSADGPDPRFTAPGMRGSPQYSVDQMLQMREQLSRQREQIAQRLLAGDDPQNPTDYTMSGRWREPGGASTMGPTIDARGLDDADMLDRIGERISKLDAQIRAATGGGPNTPSPTMELTPEQMQHFMGALADYNERWAAGADWQGRPGEPPLPGDRRTMGDFDSQAATDAARQAAPDDEDALPAIVDRKNLSGAGYKNLPYFPTKSDISAARGLETVPPATTLEPTVVDGSVEPPKKGGRRGGKKNPPAGLNPPPATPVPNKAAGKTPSAGDADIDAEMDGYYRQWFADNFPGGSPDFKDFDSWWASAGSKVKADPAARAAAAARLGNPPPTTGTAPGGPAAGASPTPAAAGGGAGTPPPATPVPGGAAPGAPQNPAPGAGGGGGGSPSSSAADDLAKALGTGTNPNPNDKQKLRDLLRQQKKNRQTSAVLAGGLGTTAALIALVNQNAAPSVAKMALRAGNGDPLGPPGGFPPGGLPPGEGGVVGDGFSDPMADDRALRMARALELIQGARVPKYQTAQNFTGGTYYR